MALGCAAARHGENRLYFPHGCQHAVTRTQEGIHHDWELAVRREGYDHVQARKPGQLADYQHRAHAGPGRLINCAGEIRMGQDGDVYLRVLSQHTSRIQPRREIVQHQAVRASVYRTACIIP